MWVVAFVFAPVFAVVFGAWWAFFVGVSSAFSALALVWFGGLAVGVLFGVFVAFGAVCDGLFWVSAFVDHVAHVVGCCSCDEVVGVDALSVVAGVGDLVAVWDCAFVEVV